MSISQVGKDILSKQHILYPMQQEYNDITCSGIPPTHSAFVFYYQTLLVACSILYAGRGVFTDFFKISLAFSLHVAIFAERKVLPISTTVADTMY